MDNKLKAKEKLFCLYYCSCRNPRSAAALAGYGIFAQRTAAKLLSRKDIRAEIERLDGEKAVSEGEVISGYRMLAFGGITDALKLLYSDGMPQQSDLEAMELLNISEIKMPKSGGIEIKFFDRLKALEKLEEISHSSSGDSALPFYDALERSAAAVRERDNG